jgi:hypothetical protein
LPAYEMPSWPVSMGTVVSQYALETGDLPRVCVLTGVPTENMVWVHWRWAPLRAHGGRARQLERRMLRPTRADRVSGYLPIALRTQRWQQVKVAAVLTGFGVGLVATVVGAGEGHAVVAAAGVGLMVGAVLVLAVKGRLVRASRADAGYVALKNAHPDFTLALEAWQPTGWRPRARLRRARKVRKAFLVRVSVLTAVAMTGVVLRLAGAADHSTGCACDATGANPPSEVYVAGIRSALCTAVDPGMVQDAISSRDDAVAGYGSGPKAAPEIAAIRKQDADLALVVTSWGLFSSQSTDSQGYVAALEAYDAALGTTRAEAASAALQRKEDALRAAVASRPSGCPAS